MNYANKDKRKTTEEKFGNPDDFIILLQYKQRDDRRESSVKELIRMNTGILTAVLGAVPLHESLTG